MCSNALCHEVGTMSSAPPSLSVALRSLIHLLEIAEKRLKTDATVDGITLREFRDALDTVRLTAWTAGEVQNAREAGRNPNAVDSFLAGERLRRLRQMIDAVRSDLEQQGAAWPASSINELQESVNLLRERLKRGAA